MVAATFVRILASVALAAHAKEACTANDETCLMQVSSIVKVNRSSAKKHVIANQLYNGTYSDNDYAIAVHDEDGNLVQGFMKIAKVCAVALLTLATSASAFEMSPQPGYVVSAGPPPSAADVHGPLQQFQQHNYDNWHAKYDHFSDPAGQAHADLIKTVEGYGLTYHTGDGVYEGAHEASLVVSGMTDAQSNQILGNYWQDSTLKMGAWDKTAKERPVALVFSDSGHTTVPLNNLVEGTSKTAQTTVGGKTYTIKADEVLCQSCGK